MARFRPIRNSLSWAFVKPVQKPFFLTRSILSGLRDIGRATARGAKRNRMETPPFDPAMNAHQVTRLDQWWKTLPREIRQRLLGEYDTWIIEQSILAERQQGTGTGQRFWSLSGSRTHRKTALRRQRGTYHMWLSLFGAGIIVVGVMVAIRDTTPMFYLMAMVFFSLLTPDILRQRVIRAQLLYGRRISFLEFCRSLPRDMRIDEDHEAFYQAALKRVMQGKTRASSPITALFYQDIYGQEDIESTETSHGES